MRITEKDKRRTKERKEERKSTKEKKKKKKKKVKTNRHEALKMIVMRKALDYISVSIGLTLNCKI